MLEPVTRPHQIHKLLRGHRNDHDDLRGSCRSTPSAESGASAQQTRGVLQTRVSADVQSFWGGEFNKSGTGFSGVGFGCSAGQDVHDPQQGVLTETERESECDTVRRSRRPKSTPADMDAGGQTPGSFPLRRRGFLEDLAGQAEGSSSQLHGQEHHALALQERQLQQVPSHPHHLGAAEPRQTPSTEPL